MSMNALILYHQEMQATPFSLKKPNKGKKKYTKTTPKNFNT